MDRTDDNFTNARFTISLAGFWRFDAVGDRIIDHMNQWIGETFQDDLIDEGIATFDRQFDLFAIFKTVIPYATL